MESRLLVLLWDWRIGSRIGGERHGGKKFCSFCLRFWVDATSRCKYSVGRDRPGLLSEVFAVLTNLRCNIASSEVCTHGVRMAALVRITDADTGAGIDRRQINEPPPSFRVRDLLQDFSKNPPRDRDVRRVRAEEEEQRRRGSASASRRNTAAARQDAVRLLPWPGEGSDERFARRGTDPLQRCGSSSAPAAWSCRTG
ncbi:hypothetical protein BRADI_2g41280v3 [Brachypodium distachyon]|uniref:ACT domain-containing protein ACR n=1 Tax=Brachypodium distachyon TaxID=15368 RepID=I1HNN2_BRADI|nr:hypothetical protein BRADI_2g41280v3 [Brachypodium distachyon]